MMIPESDKPIYRKAAYEAILSNLDNRPFNTDLFKALQTLDSAELCCGVFVTITKQGSLRGCIGCITSTDPLQTTIPTYAIQAAINDPRFPALTRSEYEDIELGLSILTPPTPISSPSDIIIGQHGIIFNYQGSRSLFLPEVAPEQGWDLEATLSQLANKAGMNASVCIEAQYEVFESIKF